MKPEILLKAYVHYQSEDAFRDLVTNTLDQVYSTGFRIVQGSPHLAEEIAVRVYNELARKAPGLGENVVLASWLRERTCKMAVKILRAEGRPIDRAILKKEKEALAIVAEVEPTPPGLASRVCLGIFLSTVRPKGFWSFLPRVWPAWIRPLHLGGAAVCLLIMIVLWRNPLHRSNPIVKSPELRMTPASFAQLASPEEGGPPDPNHMANTRTGIKPNQK